jgi:hypothetical protein
MSARGARSAAGREGRSRGERKLPRLAGILPAMSVATVQADQGVDRLERFRALRARLDPAGDPARALAEGVYIEPIRAVSARLAAELMRSPASTHLVIGGVGSGKTTELLSAQRRLNQVPDTCAIYLDVSEGHDIRKMIPGAVAVQVGLALGELQPPGDNIGCAVGWLKDLAYDHSEQYFPDSDDRNFVHVRGILVAPDQFEESVRNALEPIKTLLDALRAQWKHMIVLLDDLDRMTDMAAFEQIIEHDAKALHRLGLGVVLVGPLRALYGMDRTVEPRFDSFHYQPWLDLASRAEAKVFLANLLKKRLPEGAIASAGLEALVEASGGVLRDLLALAQSACVEAYIDGSDFIGPDHAETSIDAFGRKHMQGLRPAEIEVLKRVLTSGSFVQTSEEDLALLMTRRVLEYRSNGRPRYAVHPTIAPFLREMAGAA